MSGGAQPTQEELKELLPLAAASGFKPPFDGDERNAKSIAYHEAGHVIAGLTCGRTLNYVTIKPGNEATDFDAIEPRAYADVAKLVKTGLGGPIAEHQCFGVSWGFLGDIRQVRTHLAPHLGGRAEADVIRELAEPVQKAMKQNRQVLDALVQALLKSEALTGDEVSKLVKLE